MNTVDPAQFALEFVDQLVPGQFEKAASKLSDICTYNYQGELPRGARVLKAFIDNHEIAKKKFDAVEYLAKFLCKLFFATSCIFITACSTQLLTTIAVT